MVCPVFLFFSKFRLKVYEIADRLTFCGLCNWKSQGRRLILPFLQCITLPSYLQLLRGMRLQRKVHFVEVRGSVRCQRKTAVFFVYFNVCLLVCGRCIFMVSSRRRAHIFCAAPASRCVCFCSNIVWVGRVAFDPKERPTLVHGRPLSLAVDERRAAAPFWMLEE